MELNILDSTRHRITKYLDSSTRDLDAVVINTHLTDEEIHEDLMTLSSASPASSADTHDSSATSQGHCIHVKLLLYV